MSSAAVAENKPGETSAPLAVVPFKPRPVLFTVLLVLFLIWCAALATMYFKTVAHHPPKANVTIER